MKKEKKAAHFAACYIDEGEENMRFTKMQGCGNDYVYIDTAQEEVRDPQKLALRMSERHFGVGADGLVLIMPSETSDFRMRMFNSDGSEGEMCGNAIRCVGKYVYDRGLTQKKVITIETLAGEKKLHLMTENGVVKEVRVDMGTPVFSGREIPVAVEGEKITVQLSAAGRTFACYCLSMGNPHCVIFVENAMEFPVEIYGPLLEKDPFFPNKTNVEFVEIKDPTHLCLRIWERGSGETLACGTGVCAAAVAAAQWKGAERQMTVTMRGGDMQTEWSAENDHVFMTGPAAFSFDGVWLGKEE